ncbi:alkaline phosphatase D family protein [Nocardia takedensis]|uniref:alkaline phosphatase D family protein n=1 Tax=Nocardia takedensis TaxID=259390 RepID=UPI0003099883|nr:alkaline phosphatase D family protein [Nocardia takedensis]
MGQLILGPVLRHVDATSATVWVETDAACEVGVAGRRARTFQVGDQHFALVVVDGLEPDSSLPYEVTLDGEKVWPEPESVFPPSRIRTGPVGTLLFGSCRAAKTDPNDPGPDPIGPDALDAYARRMAARPEREWADALILLGDQVYADEPTERVLKWLEARRGDSEPKGEVVSFREYGELYRESWSDPEIRWLMSTTQTSMIFDDHDVRDDWNTSRTWREQMAALPWWSRRIRAGLASYWVYQHIGNLTPRELEELPLYRAVRDAEGDVGPMLEDFAALADLEVDGGKPARWSFRRDFGRVRLLMIDTRSGRILDGDRLMVGESEFAWLEENARGEVDHLLIGSSLPWLMPHALSHLQSLDERAAASPGLRGRLGEKLRQAADLEHWPAFRASFERLADLIRRLGSAPDAPSTICVLSGDVHHSYVARADYPRPTRSTVLQLVCSPVHNDPPKIFRLVFRLSWARPAAALLRRLADRAGISPDPLGWSKVSGPHFGNSLAALHLSGRTGRFVLETAHAEGGLRVVAEVDLP